MSSYLQAARKLQWQAGLPLRQHLDGPDVDVDAWWPTDSDLSPLASAVALVTHHDAITGTEKQVSSQAYLHHKLISRGASGEIAVATVRSR